MANVTILGIDLAKNVFQLHGLDGNDQVALEKRLSRSKLLAFMANLPPCRVAMEACGSAHYWGRTLAELGHEVKLIAPAFVKPYVRGNKTDRNDAAGICEAATRPRMRFVALKSIEQQDIQLMHRLREQLVKNRTALSNQIRGLMAEYGLIVAKGLAPLRRALPAILEDAENELTPLARELFDDAYQRLCRLDEELTRYDQRIERVARNDEVCQRLMQVEGIGPITATACRMAIGDGQAFKNGREVAAWLGLTPRQHASGERSVMKGITKRGDRYLRRLLIHGARAALRYACHKNDPRSRWFNRLRERRGANIAVVALANKNARIVWALIARGEPYRAPASTPALGAIG